MPDSPCTWVAFRRGKPHEEIQRFANDTDATRWVADHRSDGWRAVPLVGVAHGVRPSYPFQQFYPLNAVVAVTAETDEEFRNNFAADIPEESSCCLDETWRWREMSKDLWNSESHDHTRRRTGWIEKLFLNVVYEVENTLYRFHPDVSCKSTIAFFESKEVEDHVSKFGQLFSKSVAAVELCGDLAESRTSDVLNHLWIQISRYAHTVRIEMADSELTPKERVDRYKSQFKPPHREPPSDPLIADAASVAAPDFNGWKNGKKHLGRIKLQRILDVLKSSRHAEEIIADHTAKAEAAAQAKDIRERTIQRPIRR
jgi:hypothetical protein